MYYEFSNHQYEDKLVREAVSRDRLIPLLLLREGFGADDYQVDLAYAESYYVVVYMLDVHGKEKLSQLLQEYHRGRDHDEAFMSAFNQTLHQFEQGWETWVKSKFTVDIPATVNPPSQEQSLPSRQGRSALVFIALLCCVSAVGVTGLGFVVLLLKITTKKTSLN